MGVWVPEDDEGDGCGCWDFAVVCFMCSAAVLAQSRVEVGDGSVGKSVED